MAGKIKLDEELMFPSDYVSAPEFKGKDVTLTIAGVSKNELQMKGGGKKVKPVLTFKETPKKFVCNVTNADSIAQMYGTQAREWVGKRVTFFPTMTTFGKQKVECIRVREKVPGGSAPADPPAGEQSGEEFLASIGET